MPPSLRPRISVALAVIAGVLGFLGGLSAYVAGELADEQAFSVRAAAALQDDDVRAVVADRTVDALVEGAAPDLLSFRPLVTSAIDALVETRAFRRLFEIAVADAHGALLGREPSFVLELPRAGAFLVQTLRSVSPDVAQAVPGSVAPELARLDPGETELGLARRLATLGDWWWALLGLTVVAAAGAVAAALDRRRALGRVAAAAAAAGAGLAAATVIGAAVVAESAARAADLEDERERAAVLAVWNSLFGDLRTGGLLVTFAGLAVGAVTAGVLEPDHLEDVAARARRALGSARPGARALRGTVLVAAGVVTVVEPVTVLSVVGFLAGALLVFVGVADVAGSLERRAALRRGREEPRAPLVAAAIAVVVIAALAGGVVVAVRGPEPPGAAVKPPAAGCNGSPALCDRRLNEVVIPATHNSFSAAEAPGWVFANQRYPIDRQLRDGIRGLLLDVHHGIRDPESGRVRTDLRSSGTTRNRVARELSPEALDTADRLAGSVGLGDLAGPRGLFLCHTLCELGAEPLEQELRVLRTFLYAEPGAVVVVFLESYVPSAEIEAALERAGLLELTAELERDAPLPTLGELVATGDRLVVLTEEPVSPRPWLHPGFAFVQDTPLGATVPAELRCDRFRGTPDSPILMINHWIDDFPPPPSDNAAIGGRFLRDRIRDCERRRGISPGLVVVDFYERSGVVAIAESLNRG